MMLRQIALALFAALIALALGAKDQIAFEWDSLKVGTQILIAVVGFSVVMLIAGYLFRPLIVQLLT